MEQEIWKDIEGYEGLYKISSFGSVFSVRVNRLLLENIHHSGYKYVILHKNNQRKYFAISRLVATHFLPNLENKQQVDHIDRDPLNNHISNLRWATSGENSRNKSSYKNSSSKYKGVSFSKTKKKWISMLSINNKDNFLGYFYCEKEAALAYNKKAKEMFGEFANLNDIE
jgi:hypothetical protein